jgi:two-component system sensor histidine kinase HydH
MDPQSVLHMKNKARPAAPRISPWFFFIPVLLLAAVVAAITLRNAGRERRAMTFVLLEKGTALIRTVEAGARTGMMGMAWGESQVQTLLEEAAKQQDVLYIAVCAPDGKILAHSDRTRIGQNHPLFPSPAPPGSLEFETWRYVSHGNTMGFEVYRTFRPLRRGRFHISPFQDGPPPDRSPRPPPEGCSRGPDGWCAPPPPDREAPVILAGLDMKPLVTEREKDIRTSFLISGALFLVGLAGMASLFWAQHYRTAQRLLKDADAFADVLVASLPVGLIATDPEGRVVFHNSAAEALTGVFRSGALGREADALFQERLPVLGEFLHTSGPVLEKEIESVVPGKGPVSFAVSAARVVNADGQQAGQVLILRDLSQIRALEEEIRRKEKLAALGGLAAGVAHEIRNPLSSIKGLATYFGSMPGAGEEERQAARVMVNEVERLNRAVSGLLEFARPAELSRRKTDVRALAAHTLRLVREDAAARGVAVPHAEEDGPLVALLDPDRLSQCLLNLYLNAIEAMENGGELRVRSAEAAGDTLEITVEDTGKGIPKEDLEKIFEPYYTAKPSGTGLGLAVVHKIVTAHGGHVRVESQPGLGARFTLVFPGALDGGNDEG